MCHAREGVLRARLFAATVVSFDVFQGRWSTGTGSPASASPGGNGNDAVGPGQAAHHAGASMRAGERQTMDYFAGNETRTVRVNVRT
jgi:hypothetical protein